MKTTTVTLPRLLAEDAEEAAISLGMSVNEFLVKALHKYLEAQPSVIENLLTKPKYFHEGESDPLDHIAYISYN